MDSKVQIIAIGAGLGLALVYLSKGASMGEAGKAAGSAVVEAANGVMTGVVTGIGEAVGIPQTDKEKGQAALAAGDYWEASFLLPAGDFLSGTWERLWK